MLLPKTARAPRTLARSPKVGALRLPRCGVVTEVDATGLQLHEPCCRREVVLGVGWRIVLGNSVGCPEVFVFGLGIDRLSSEHHGAIGRVEDDGLMTR